jgi:hypothetical protein
VTQLSAVLCAGSLVSCHNFLSSACVLMTDLNQEGHYLCLKV